METSKPGAGPQQEAAGFRVMIVEDSRPVADIFAMLLRALGHEVAVCLSAADALQQLEAFTPEVVFSDISMPGMNGYELAERLRADERTRLAYLVAMTGYGQVEDRENSLDAGFDEHLVKPAEMDDLQAMFATLQQRRQAGLPLSDGRS